jgi:AcrR family transcriptional regulator
LLDAAGHVFAEQGWAGATVEAIVTRAGMSRRTFYEHFADLRACLLALGEKISAIALRNVESHIRDVEDPDERLRLGVEAFLGGIAAFPHMARVMLREARTMDSEFERIHEAMMSRFAALAMEGVERAYAQGRATQPPDELKIFALIAGMEAVALRFVMRGEEDRAPSAAPILIELFRRSFA